MYTLPELAAAQYVAAGAKPRPPCLSASPAKVGRAYRAGANLTGDNVRIAGRGWREFLTA